MWFVVEVLAIADARLRAAPVYGRARAGRWLFSGGASCGSEARRTVNRPPSSLGFAKVWDVYSHRCLPSLGSKAPQTLERKHLARIIKPA